MDRSDPQVPLGVFACPHTSAAVRIRRVRVTGARSWRPVQVGDLNRLDVGGSLVTVLPMGSSPRLDDRFADTAHGERDAAVGWYPDPLNGSRLRFFDGSRWTGAARPVDGRLDVEPEHVPPAVLLDLPAPGERVRRRVLRRWLGPVAACAVLVALAVAAWMVAPSAPGRGVASDVSASSGEVLIGGGVPGEAAATLVFVAEGVGRLEVVSFGEGCAVESGPSGVEYRVGASDAGVEVGVAATSRTSGYAEVSVVVRTDPTEPEQQFVFSSDGSGSGDFGASMDGSGFTADLVLVDHAGATATLSGSAACSP